MRHRKGGRKFDMPADQRMAMFRNITTAVLTHGGVRTTEARAKEARRFVDRMVTLGKDGSLASRRRAIGFLYNKGLVAELFDEIAPRYAERNGGYTRVVKLVPRRGDGAKLARLELV
jgi:large subunit ribosomal protein L17